MEATVLFRRISSHDVSLSDSEDASQIFGRVEGQSTAAGAEPLDGESGSARFKAANGAATAAAYVSGEASRGTTMLAAWRDQHEILEIVGDRTTIA
jgi:hypothetical protein